MRLCKYANASECPWIPDKIVCAIPTVSVWAYKDGGILRIRGSKNSQEKNCKERRNERASNGKRKDWEKTKERGAWGSEPPLPNLLGINPEARMENCGQGFGLRSPPSRWKLIGSK